MQQQLSQQALSLSNDRRTSLEIDIQRKLLALNTAKELATRELQLEVAAAEAKFNDKLFTVVEQIGRDEGFSLLLDSAAVAWADEAVDVTSLIVERFNHPRSNPHGAQLIFSAHDTSLLGTAVNVIVQAEAPALVDTDLVDPESTSGARSTTPRSPRSGARISSIA